MSVRRVGTWKDALRRYADAAVAAALPGGWWVASILAKVDGYLYPHEAVFLYWLARSAPGTGSIVEIGSYRGRSTLCLATGAREHGKTRVIAVDPHVYKTGAELTENLQHFGMAEIVEPVALPSVDAARRWQGRVRVLFVDGHHERASVEADVDSWLPHLEPRRLRPSSRFDGHRRLPGAHRSRQNATATRFRVRGRGAVREHPMGEASRGPRSLAASHVR